VHSFNPLVKTISAGPSIINFCQQLDDSRTFYSGINHEKASKSKLYFSIASESITKENSSVFTSESSIFQSG